MSRVLAEDTEQIVCDQGIPFAELRGGVVLVTGATGIIGSALVRALSAANEAHGLGLRIIAFGRDEAKAARLRTQYGAETVCQDIRAPLSVDGPVDFIFHCAAVTNSAQMAADPVGVAETTIVGTGHVLALARETRVKSMVFLSSMEVYGRTDRLLASVTEEDLGFLDLKRPRSCYPESKRMSECLCACWHAQYGVPVKIARLAQTFGAGSAPDAPQVYAQFARSAIAGENIVLHTEGRSRGNYCYLADAVRGLLLLLLKGENGEAYNIANPEASRTIREMAELVMERICGGRAAVVVDVPQDIARHGYAADATIRLNTRKIEQLGWRPKVGLVQMYERMIADWQEQQK